MGLVGFSPRVLGFSVDIVLVFELGVALVAANHGRSLHRARLSCHLPDLTLYESPHRASEGAPALHPAHEIRSRGFRAKRPRARARTRPPRCLSPTPSKGASAPVLPWLPGNPGVLRVPREELEPACQACQSADARSCLSRSQRR